jgi:hypothetical protein
MKYLKTFEGKLYPQIGDFVIGDPTNFTWAKNIIKSNIGKIVVDSNKSNKGLYYKVLYVTDVYSETFTLHVNEILYWSKNKEDLEIYIQVNKYNL